MPHTQAYSDHNSISGYSSDILPIPTYHMLPSKRFFFAGSGRVHPGRCRFCRALPWPRGSVAASRLLLVAFFYMPTAMAERQRRGTLALACCFFLYGDCHGREAASQKLCSYATICGSPSICANQHSSPSSIFTLPLVPSVISASTVFTSPKGNKTLNSTFSV